MCGHWCERMQCRQVTDGRDQEALYLHVFFLLRGWLCLEANYLCLNVSVWHLRDRLSLVCRVLIEIASNAAGAVTWQSRVYRVTPALFALMKVFEKVGLGCRCLVDESDIRSLPHLHSKLHPFVRCSVRIAVCGVPDM